jgi:hypothetical protein
METSQTLYQQNLTMVYIEPSKTLYQQNLTMVYMEPSQTLYQQNPTMVYMERSQTSYQQNHGSLSCNLGQQTFSLFHSRQTPLYNILQHIHPFHTTLTCPNFPLFYTLIKSEKNY